MMCNYLKGLQWVLGRWYLVQVRTVLSTAAMVALNGREKEHGGEEGTLRGIC
jgi:hypothetical protein